MVREGNFEGVDEDEMDDFRRLVWQRQGQHSDWDSLERLKNRTNALGRLNEFMEHAVLDVRDLSQVSAMPVRQRRSGAM